jgi:hypothetical protein
LSWGRCRCSPGSIEPPGEYDVRSGGSVQLGACVGVMCGGAACGRARFDAVYEKEIMLPLDSVRVDSARSPVRPTPRQLPCWRSCRGKHGIRCRGTRRTPLGTFSRLESAPCHPLTSIGVAAWLVDIAWWALRTGKNDFTVGGDVDELVLEKLSSSFCSSIGGSLSALPP